ncbi:hypothetical protein BX611_0399 [Lutibacter oceani]|uniref:Cytochrome c domain-containing protein n=1 Tax=Lutibacter oceani TaxID=1853311 RepID=A0A3D9RT12_9FLAO|nr:hypothetical protein [Lutibacter oceani]REE83119.1 hypothetical protein BX611_0399 [Lutibacter oceani]
MKKLLALTGLFLLFIFTSCSSNSDDDDITIDPPTSTITYTNTISAIISGNCTGCHGSTPTNNAPMSLTSYADVKSAIETRGLIGRIENGTMPPNGNLTATQIQNIKTWQANGFPQ